MVRRAGSEPALEIPCQIYIWYGTIGLHKTNNHLKASCMLMSDLRWPAMNMLDRNSTGPNRFRERQDKARTHQRPLDEHNIGNLNQIVWKKWFCMCKQPSQATWSEIQLIDVGNQGGYGRPFPGHVLGGNLVTVGLRFPPGPQTVGWSAPPGPQTVGLGNKGFATRWTHAESQQLVWSGGLRVEDAWTLMGFILGPCWICVKRLLDKALQRWVEELWGKELQAEKEVQDSRKFVCYMLAG